MVSNQSLSSAKSFGILYTMIQVFPVTDVINGCCLFRNKYLNILDHKISKNMNLIKSLLISLFSVDTYYFGQCQS